MSRFLVLPEHRKDASCHWRRQQRTKANLFYLFGLTCCQGCKLRSASLLQLASFSVNRISFFAFSTSSALFALLDNPSIFVLDVPLPEPLRYGLSHQIARILIQTPEYCLVWIEEPFFSNLLILKTAALALIKFATRNAMEEREPVLCARSWGSQVRISEHGIG